MYVTRPLSMYKRDPAALSNPPPEGPNSGYLVILDEEAQAYTCFGMCKDSSIKHLPFPQNKNLSITYTSGENTIYDKIIFIPVLNQPLSSNCYYVIRRQGKHQGYVFYIIKLFVDHFPDSVSFWDELLILELVLEHFGLSDIKDLLKRILLTI